MDVVLDSRMSLVETNPERYATTGLDWGNRAHHAAIANGLFQTLMEVLARQQCLFGDPQWKVLRRQQERIEQRLGVIERKLWRNGEASPRWMDDQVIIYGLEKMADAFEGGAQAWQDAKASRGKNVLAGTLLGVGVAMAGNIRGNGGLSRFSVGPFAGLSRIASMVSRIDVALEMEDLPLLNKVVNLAREIPIGHPPEGTGDSAVRFSNGLRLVTEMAVERDRNPY